MAVKVGSGVKAQVGHLPSSLRWGRQMAGLGVGKPWARTVPRFEDKLVPVAPKVRGGRARQGPLAALKADQTQDLVDVVGTVAQRRGDGCGARKAQQIDYRVA